ncbi:hypothetical protein ACH5RR_012695 [Cinchona calisaya]|uniref:Uncharacterized protein n=1 Tax=Cinchona calisaya TaxID=153742 RepID=A0ABD3A8J9_9GENT
MVDNIDDCSDLTINMLVIRKLTTKLGYEDKVNSMYIIPIEGAKYSMLGLDIDEHVDDMATKGIIYGEVEMLIVDAFQNKFVSDQVESSTIGLGVNEYINLTFKEIHLAGDVVLGDNEGENFYDNDYEFRGDGDGIIYDKYVYVDVDERGELVTNDGTSLEREREANIDAIGSHCNRDARGVRPIEALKSALWACARAPYTGKFEAEMESLKAFYETTYKWLIENSSPN